MLQQPTADQADGVGIALAIVDLGLLPITRLLRA